MFVKNESNENIIEPNFLMLIRLIMIDINIGINIEIGNQILNLRESVKEFFRLCLNITFWTNMHERNGIIIERPIKLKVEGLFTPPIE